MKVILPTDLDFTLKLIPRFYGYNSELTVSIYSEELRKEVSYITDEFSVIDGIFSIDLHQTDFAPITFTEQQTYQIKITDTEVVYRGKLLCTAQNTQDFKLTKGLYSYE